MLLFFGGQLLARGDETDLHDARDGGVDLYSLSDM